MAVLRVIGARVLMRAIGRHASTGGPSWGPYRAAARSSQDKISVLAR
jgi:hypothetical protein